MPNARPWTTQYGTGVPFDIPEEHRTLDRMLAGSAAAHPTEIALVYYGRRITYRALDAAVDAAARGLIALGVRPSDRVALLLPNCPEHVIAFYAIHRAGGVVVEHNPLYTADELAPLFSDHGAAVAVVWDHVGSVVRQLRARTPLETVISVSLKQGMPLRLRAALALPLARTRKTRQEIAGEPIPGALSWGSLGRRGPRPEVPGRTAEDPAVIQYTSGTSGTPKGVVLTHRSLLANAAQGRAWVPGIERGRQTIYAVLPMFHAYGLTLCMTFAMSIGARLVLFPTFDATSVLRTMRRDPATFLPAVPPIYDALLHAAERAGVSLAGIRYAISGAMSLPEETVAKWERATGGGLVEGYGMTEASPIIAGNPFGGTRREGSVGVPFPGTDMRVRDPEDPENGAVPSGQVGELQVRGPQICAGYWNRPEETRRTILPGGWLRTGDLVRVDRDGFITIVDRIKELIISGGFNVIPAEVERALRAFPDVLDVAVVGVPHRRGGEQVAAALVLRTGVKLDRRKLVAFCKEHLADYKIPRRFAQVNDLPRSMVGKVMRRFVREQVFG
jgi:long-chain acyl-CoA synthetase